jgi:hypothetical protein
MPYIWSKCRHLMPSGVNCHAAALKGKPYCYHHARLHGLKTAPPIRGKKLRLPLLIDRNAIQAARDLLTDALGSGRIDIQHAAMILYAIVIGAQNIDRTTHQLTSHESQHQESKSIADSQKPAPGNPPLVPGPWSLFSNP